MVSPLPAKAAPFLAISVHVGRETHLGPLDREDRARVVTVLGAKPAVVIGHAQRILRIRSRHDVEAVTARVRANVAFLLDGRQLDLESIGVVIMVAFVAKRRGGS